jgi:hypothetical protein
VNLTPIELALMAELNLELARGHEEVAEDPAQPPESRRVAREKAAALRERARRFQAQADRVSAEPATACPASTPEPDSAYTGPERRQGARRTSTRRGDPQAVLDSLGAVDRRTGVDRRRRERRRRALALR